MRDTHTNKELGHHIGHPVSVAGTDEAVNYDLGVAANVPVGVTEGLRVVGTQELRRVWVVDGEELEVDVLGRRGGGEVEVGVGVGGPDVEAAELLPYFVVAHL